MLPLVRGDKSTRGASSQFFVAGELCRRDLIAVVTLGNTPNTDILCSNTAGTKFVHIQVKTYVPGGRTVSVGKKAEIARGPGFIWVLAGIPLPGSQKDFEYYVIPANVVAQNVSESHRLWLKCKGKKGQDHKDSDVRTITLPPGKCFNGWEIGKYKNNWSLIEALLKD